MLWEYKKEGNMKLSYAAAMVGAVIAVGLVGCGGSGGGAISSGGALVPLPGQTFTPNPAPLLRGNYGSLIMINSAANNSASVDINVATLDGIGSVTYAGGENLTSVTGLVTQVPNAGGNGTFTVDQTRHISFNQTVNGATQTTVSGMVSSNGNLDVNNLVLADGTHVFQIMVRTATNATNANLKGTYHLAFEGSPQFNLFIPIVGNITFDGNGNITAGTLVDTVVGAPPFSITGVTGTYTVTSNGGVTGVFSGTASDGSGTVTVPFNGFVGADNSLQVAVQDSFGDVGFMQATIPAFGAGNGNLAGTPAFESNNPLTNGVTFGNLLTDGVGHITGGTLGEDEGNVVPVIGGSYNIQSDGTFSAFNIFFAAQPGAANAESSIAFFLNNDGTYAYGPQQDNAGFGNYAIVIP